MVRSKAMIDLVGIGALNLDFIASRKSVQELDPETIPELSTRFEHGTETKVNDAEIDATLSQMGHGAFETFLGGSTFNTINAIAHTYRGLKLGYIGSEGTSAPHEISFSELLEQLGVETSFINRSSNHCGRCISYIVDGERTLFTAQGANSELAEYLQKNYQEILNYLSRSKMIHVTSFFDDETPIVLSKLLNEAKQENPWLKISFDPGYEWTENLTNSVEEILRISDFVFLNNREFQILGKHRPGKQDVIMAREIYSLCDDNSVLIVLKRYDSIKLLYKVHGRIMERHFANRVLPEDVIEDATGAGDIFAAGFLCGMLIPGLELSYGVDLGLRLVRSKLLVPGYSNFDRFSAIFAGMINDITSEVTVPPRKIVKEQQSQMIFIGHGRSPVWALVEKHLKEDLSLPCKMFESEPRAGRHVLSVLSEMLDTCGFAIMVMTAEDEVDNDLFRARQNVLHEIGLFHGRYEFNKVIILMQKGVEPFSNIDGLQYIEFDGVNINKAFYELDNVLRREGILS